MTARPLNDSPPSTEDWGRHLWQRYAQPGLIGQSGLMIQRQIESRTANFVNAIHQRWGQASYAAAAESLPIVRARPVVPQTAPPAADPAVAPKPIAHPLAGSVFIQRASLASTPVAPTAITPLAQTPTLPDVPTVPPPLPDRLPLALEPQPTPPSIQMQAAAPSEPPPLPPVTASQRIPAASVQMKAAQSTPLPTIQMQAAAPSEPPPLPLTITPLPLTRALPLTITPLPLTRALPLNSAPILIQRRMQPTITTPDLRPHQDAADNLPARLHPPRQTVQRLPLVSITRIARHIDVQRASAPPMPGSINTVQPGRNGTDRTNNPPPSPVMRTLPMPSIQRATHFDEKPSSHDQPPHTADSSSDQLVDAVMRKLMRRLTIEAERRGIKRWF